MIYIAFLFFTFLILILAFYQWQYHMIFSPVYYRNEKMCKNCELISVVTDDGIELEGVVYEPQTVTNTLLIFVGRHHDGVGLINKLSLCYPNVRIIVFNYRSYGKSKGVASEKNLLRDGVKIAELIQKNYGDFYILGFSLGSNIGAYVASKHKVKALFLVGAFDSIASLAKSKFVDRGFFPMIKLSKVFRYKFITKFYVKDVDADTYLFVSRDDETTYIENARELKKHIKNLGDYMELDGLSHKELFCDKRVTNKINELII